MSEDRAEVLGTVGSLVPDPERPVLVAIDGADGAGKTWFADELAGVLADRGRPVVRASVDDFHHPRAHRHALGRTAESVWSRHFDYPTLRRELLEPWQRGAGTSYRRAWHDVATDRLLDVPAERVPERGVLLVDGVFAQRPELGGTWDLVVFLEVPFEVSVSRMAARDGGVDDVEDHDQRRYVEAQRTYLRDCDPRQRADVVVDNTDLAHPHLLAIRRPRHSPLRNAPLPGGEWSIS